MAGRQRASARAPTRRGASFDAFDVARRQVSLHGNVDATTLTRVADRLAEDGGGDAVLAWRITGSVDGSGHPALDISLDGNVPLVCQRCLETFDWPVAQRTTVLLARDERELARLDAGDEREVVLAKAPLEALSLIEDELLLTLPFSPRCERDACTEEAVLHGAEAPRAPASAFAGLADLTRHVAKPTKR